jgi:hypothetical protein
MPTKARVDTRKRARRKKPEANSRRIWQFAPDAIGMFSGPRDLSVRKGLNA